MPSISRAARGTAGRHAGSNTAGAISGGYLGSLGCSSNTPLPEKAWWHSSVMALSRSNVARTGTALVARRGRGFAVPS